MKTGADASTVEETVREHSRRICALEDERAVLDCIYATMHAIDDKRQAVWLNCFTSDATFRFRRPGADGWAFELAGEEMFREWIAAHAGVHPPGFEDHVIVNPRIVVDESTARATSYFLAIRDTGGELIVFAAGRYEDSLLRCEDGAWRIRERTALGEMPVPEAIRGWDATGRPRAT